MMSNEHDLTDDMIPEPCGYTILIMMPDVDETYEGSGIVKSSKQVRDETIMSMVGAVIALGKDAYTDKKRFPNGPWCKEGDFVMFRALSGTRFKVGKKEFRLLNDDSIQAVVSNPKYVKSV